MKKLICITGPDGSGKTTVIDELRKIFAPSDHAHIWKLLGMTSGLPFRSKEDIDSFLCQLSPDSRLLFLAHAFKFAIDSCMGSANEYVFINGYYYKYFASELVLGASRELAADLMKIFPEPDITFFLDYPMKATAERKITFSRYECGLSDKPGINSFIEFQERCLAEWAGFRQPGWIWISPGAELLEKLDIISKYLRK